MPSRTFLIALSTSSWQLVFLIAFSPSSYSERVPDSDADASIEFIFFEIPVLVAV